MRLFRTVLAVVTLLSLYTMSHAMENISSELAPYAPPPFYHCIEGEQIVLLHPIAENRTNKIAIWIKSSQQQKVLATLERAPVIIYRDAKGKNAQAVFTSEKTSTIPKGAKSVAGYRGDNGSAWTLSTTYKMEKNNTVLIQQSLWSNSPQKLVRFGGITLRAGDGGFGSARDEALFGGLEYLLSSEGSSSTLDITSEDHVRFAPHPNKVTVPVMSVNRDGWMVALMWNPLQKWDGEHVRPRPLFSSPNNLERQNNHLMGLFLPSIEYGRESEIDAREPYDMRPGKGITLTARIVAHRAEHCVDAVDDWVRSYGFPKPIQTPRPWKDSLELSLNPFMGSLWIPEEKSWYGDYGKGRGNKADLCALLLKATELLPGSELAQQARERAEMVAQTLGQTSSSLRFAYDFGRVRQGFKDSSDWARGIISSQKPDGSWRFYAGKDDFIAGFPRSKLGVNGETASGIVATNALIILRHARITGDQQALEAGLEAVGFLDRFTRPQAAQVWEVPVHAPDILASARCSETCIEAYRITGDRKYLDKAVYWARTGIPFVYFWGAPEREIMKFGSIAIFGSSIMVVPWFGKPVQWNGVAYAQVLLQLAEYDHSFNWRGLAEGIVTNCAQQQFTEGELIGLYPDWTSALTGGNGSPWITPAQFYMDDILYLMGKQPSVDTAVIRTAQGRVHVSAAAHVGAALDPSSKILSVQLTDAIKSKPAAFTVVGLGKPSEVLWNSRVITEGEEDAPGAWTYAGSVLVVTSDGGGDGVCIVKYNRLEFSLEPSVPEPQVGLRVEAPQLIAGQQDKVRVVLINQGKEAVHDLKLTVTMPQGWRVTDPDTGSANQKTFVIKELRDDNSQAAVLDVIPATTHGSTYRWVEAVAEYGGVSSHGAEGFFIQNPAELGMRVTDVTTEPGQIVLKSVIHISNRTDKPLSGKLSIAPPQGCRVEIAGSPEFKIAKANGSAELTAKIIAPLGSKPGISEAALKVATAAGELPPVPVEIELPVPCPKSKGPITIDGSAADWANAVWFPIYSQVKHKDETMPQPASPEDMSAQVSARWDTNALYLAFKITDNDWQNKSGGDIWNSDSIQLGLDGMCERSVDGWDKNDHEYGFALTDSGPLAWCWIAPEGEAKGERKSIKLSANRQRNNTFYEIAIPWKDVGRLTPAVGAPVGISFLVNDVDSDGARKALELGGGIGLRKEPSKFVVLMLGS